MSDNAGTIQTPTMRREANASAYRIRVGGIQPPEDLEGTAQYYLTVPCAYVNHAGQIAYTSYVLIGTPAYTEEGAQLTEVRLCGSKGVCVSPNTKVAILPGELLHRVVLDLLGYRMF